ncbi:MAG: hypothetical protein IT191_02660 [Microbacteriaceae bacterium]|nr:hypothetical protein [Microbacteriaceae bacterium]
MKRFKLSALAAIFGSFFLLLPATDAFADGFDVDPVGDEVNVYPKTAVEFFGNSPSSKGTIYGFVDGRLLTCDDYFGNELDTNEIGDCWQIGSDEGEGRWRFIVTKPGLERLGLSFLGKHEFRFVYTERVNGNTVILAEATFTAELVSQAATPTPTAAPEISPGESKPVASGLSSGSSDAPSVLSKLRDFGDVVANPGNLPITAVVTLVLVALIGLPSTFLDQTLSENYHRVFGWTSKLVDKAKSVIRLRPLPTWLPVGIGIALACFISGFVDPGFGLNLGSIRMFVSIVLALVIEDVLGWVVIRRVLKHVDPELEPRPEFKFGFLLVVIAAVILTRVTGFEPGLIFGLVLGMSFGVTLALSRDARVKLVGLGWALAIGVIAWVGYGTLSGASGFWPVFASETLGAVSLSTLSAFPIALLPIRGMDGGVIFKWNWRIWGAAYIFGLLIFFVVLMPMPFSWAEVGAPLATWVVMFIAYFAVAIGLWAWLRFGRAKPTEAQVESNADFEESKTAS